MTVINKGGRPPFTPTRQQRNDVRILKADGWSDVRIARVLDISFPTLKKYFSRELEHGADLEEHELLRVLLKAAKKGNNAAAVRMAFERIDRGKMANRDGDLPRSVRPADGKARRPGQPLGKKEQEKEAALAPDKTTAFGSLLDLRQGSSGPKEGLN